MISWSWFLILAFNFKEEVTQTKRERERKIETIVHFQERFLREREQEKTKEKPLQKFSRTRKKRKSTNFKTIVPAEWHESRGSRTTINASIQSIQKLMQAV